MDFAKYLGVADGAPGTIMPHTGFFSLRVMMDDGREFGMWGECIGPMAEGAD